MADGESPEDRLGLPYKVTRTPQEKGRIEEVKMARKRGATPHPGSGAGKIKDDASNDDYLYEFKNVSRVHTLKGADLLALFKRSIQQSKEAQYVIYFEQENLTATITLRRGKHV